MLWVDVDGVPVQVERPDRTPCDERTQLVAEEAARDWRFVPLRVGSSYVEFHTKLTVEVRPEAPTTATASWEDRICRTEPEVGASRCMDWPKHGLSACTAMFASRPAKLTGRLSYCWNEEFKRPSPPLPDQVVTVRRARDQVEVEGASNERLRRCIEHKARTVDLDTFEVQVLFYGTPI